MQRVKRRNYEQFQIYKNSCGRLDAEAVEYARKACLHNDSYKMSEDLSRSFLRYQYRSIQDDNYIDLFFSKIVFQIRGHNRKAISCQKVFGILPNGSRTGDFLTDENGERRSFTGPAAGIT